MNRMIMALLVTGLLGTATASETVQSTTLRQNALLLSSDVSAVRTALARPGADPRVVLSTYVPRLLDRARTASANAAQFQKRIGISAATLQYKALVADARSDIDDLANSIKQIQDQLQQIGDARRKVEQVAQRIEQLLPKLESVVASDPFRQTQTCVLPNAVTAVVNGICAITSCSAGWRNADGNVANGCELADSAFQPPPQPEWDRSVDLEIDPNLPPAARARRFWPPGDLPRTPSGS